MTKKTKNIGASVRARLLNIAARHNQTFDLVLARHANERLLYRLSISPHADRFVLKGATLLMTWLPEPHRGTRDSIYWGSAIQTPRPCLGSFATCSPQ